MQFNTYQGSASPNELSQLALEGKHVHGFAAEMRMVASGVSLMSCKYGMAC